MSQSETLAAQQEIRQGARFGFGRNWRRFLAVVDQRHVEAAEGSLRRMLERTDLHGRRFLDIGSGSGLFSLAARRLGATVHSFDYDAQSVECTRELKRRYCPGDIAWTIEQGSILDRAYVEHLGQFDVVYSWGVLHHTGAMWQALEHAAIPVAPSGQLFVAIYNDQGGKSRRWRAVKRLYCSSVIGRTAVCAAIIPYFASHRLLIDCLKGNNPLAYYREYKSRRGMSPVHDWLDWLGGYPFEVAKPEQIFAFYRDKGFTLTNLTTKGALAGCNEFVLRRASVT
jgi:2-polyprenyl-3-methyl-5-hydroxy-6-metoxy-1,4-benzoquinol methylase